MTQLDTSEEIFTRVFGYIKATDVEMDFGGDEALVCLTVQIDITEDLGLAWAVHAFLNIDGTSQVFYGGDEFSLGEDAYIWDIRLSAEGADGSLTPQQHRTLRERIGTVIDQGLAAAKEVLGGKLDYTDPDTGWDEAKAADVTLKAQREQILAAANA